VTETNLTGHSALCQALAVTPSCKEATWATQHECMKEKRQKGNFCSDAAILNRQFYRTCELSTEFVIYAYVASQRRSETPAIKIPHPQGKAARWTS